MRSYDVDVLVAVVLAVVGAMVVTTLERLVEEQVVNFNLSLTQE